MADTLPYGPVVPKPTESISESGVAEIRTLGSSVSGALGAAQLFTESVDADSRARDTALGDQIAGMEGLDYVGTWDDETTYRINDVVTWGGDSWARLTAGSSGVPGESATDWGLVAKQGEGGGFGELNETEVTGLYDTVDSGIDARLAAVEALAYRSGRRDITALLAPAPVSGNLYIERRGDVIWLHMDSLVLSSTEFASRIFSNVIADGFKAIVPVDLPSAPRVIPTDPPGVSDDADTSVRTYNHVLTFYRIRAGMAIRGLVSWPTNQAIPTTLPGTPA